MRIRGCRTSGIRPLFFLLLLPLPRVFLFFSAFSASFFLFLSPPLSPSCTCTSFLSHLPPGFPVFRTTRWETQWLTAAPLRCLHVPTLWCDRQRAHSVSGCLSLNSSEGDSGPDHGHVPACANRLRQDKGVPLSSFLRAWEVRPMGSPSSGPGLVSLPARRHANQAPPKKYRKK